jgi:hypothetical protein
MLALGAFLFVRAEPVTAQEPAAPARPSDADGVVDREPVLPNVTLGQLMAGGLDLRRSAADDGVAFKLEEKGGWDPDFSIDLAGQLPLAGSQGPKPSCVGWALAYAVHSAHAWRKGRAWGRGVDSIREAFSPAFLYHSVSPGPGSGVNPVAALRFLTRVGSLPYSRAPYDSLARVVRYTASDTALAGKHRIRGWRAIGGVRGIVEALRDSQPVFLGIEVDEGFDLLGRATWHGLEAHDPGMITTRYWHALVIVGVDGGRDAFRVLNSRGKGWGEKGYGWISRTVLQEQFRRDAFAAHLKD